MACHTAVQLEKGMRLGTVTPVELVPMTNSEGVCQPEVVHRIGVTSRPVNERLEQLSAKLELDQLNLLPTERQQLQSLIESYSDVFALDSSELGSTELVTHTIYTGDHRPVCQPARRTPFALRRKFDQLVQEMLDQNVVEPSSSPWASPIVLVQKKDGGVRFCVDYRRLNSLTKLDEFPLAPY